TWPPSARSIPPPLSPPSPGAMTRPERPSRPSSGRLLSAGAGLALALLAGPLASAPQDQVPTVIIGGTDARFAIPPCVPRKPDQATIDACGTVQAVLRNDLEFEGLFQFVPESLIAAVPAQNPDAPNF